MTKSLFLLCLAGLGLGVIIYIFIINKIMKTKIVIFDIIVIFAFGISSIVYGTLGYLSYEKGINLHKDNIYKAVQNLKSGDFDEALKKADNILHMEKNNVEAIQIKAIVNNLTGNYKEAEIAVLSFIEANDIDPIKDKRLEQLLKMTKVGQGEIDEDTYISLGIPKNENEYVISEEKKQEIIQKLSDEAMKSFTNLKLPSQKKIEMLDKIIEIEKALMDNNNDKKVEEEILRLSIENEKDVEINKLAVKILLQSGNFEQAAKTMEKVIINENTLENKLILSDIYANYLKEYTDTDKIPQDSIFAAAATDDEIKKLEEVMLRKQGEIAELENKIEEEKNQKKAIKLEENKEKLQNEINDLEKRIAATPLKKVINYIEAQKPFLGKNSPDYELQLSKLYFAADKKEQAKKHLQKALKIVSKLETKSEVTKELQEINNIYEQGTNLIDDFRIPSKVNNVVNNLNNGFIPATDMNLNGEFGNFVVSYIKYSKADVFISQVDTSNYPQISAYVNVSEDKQGFWKNKSDFAQKDFIIEDTGLSIDNFTVNKNVSKNIDIALVFDKSGSMEGRPIDDAKAAGKNFIDNIDDSQRVAIVTFDTSAYVENSLTSQKDSLSNSINNIVANGGTSIYKGLETAVDLLGNTMGSKAIILLSDGRDSNSTPIKDTINAAKRASISVYTVGFGDVDDEYLRGIAEGTGGKYLKANTTTELVDIYSVLQKYIMNNYIINYNVEENQDIKDRNLIVKLKNIQGEGSKDYIVGSSKKEVGKDEDNEDQEQENEIGKVDLVSTEEFMLTSVTNGSILGTDTKKEIFIEINGVNIPKNTRIRFGNKEAVSVTYENDRKIKAKLPQDMIEGEYDIIGITPEGKVSKLENALSIYNTGTLTSLKVGNLKIKANNIQKINETKYMAKGNVIINGVLRVNGDLDITALNKTSKDNEYAAGDVESASKIYIAFEKDNHSFIGGLLEGKEWIITNGKFNISSNNKERNKTVLKRSSAFNLDIVMFNLEVGTIYIVPDGLEFTAAKFALNDLGGKDDRDKGNTNLIKGIVKSNKFLPVSGEATFRVTEKDILTKAAFKLKFGGKDGLKIPYLKAVFAQEAGITLDTIGPVRKFEISGKCGLPFLNVSAFSFTYNGYSKKLIMPNELTVKLSLKEGIPLNATGNVTLKSLGLGVGTMYDAIEKNNWKDLSVVGVGDIGFNLSPVSLPLVGKIDVLAFSDIKASAKLNLDRLSLGGKVKVLGIQLAEGTATYEDKDNNKSFLINTKGEIKLELLVAGFRVDGDYILSVSSDGFISDGKVNGYFHNYLKDVKGQGQGSIRITVNKDITTFTIILKSNDDMFKFRVAMDNNASILNLKEKFQVECN